MQKLYENHKDQVDFFWVYSQEARSSDTGLKESKDKSPLKAVKNHRTLEERKISAAQCAKEISSSIPQLLDDLDHSITIRYHGHPTRLYVIGKNNKISYAGKLGPFGTNMKAFTKAILSFSSPPQKQNHFNQKKDLFIAQFDSIPDPDDIHSQAAVGSILSHPKFKDVNALAVAGAYGIQIATSRRGYIDSTPLLNHAFGSQALASQSPKERAAAGWVSAHGGATHADYSKNADGQWVRPQSRIDAIAFACKVIIEKAKPVLAAGGRVFVMEAGQSDLTAEWVEKLIVEEGITNTATNVILVQHSLYNEKHTPGHPSKPQVFDDGKNDWEFINDPKNLTYVRIDDGNYPYGSTVKDRDRGEISTPNFKNKNPAYLLQAIDAKNPNAHTRKMWRMAKKIAETQKWGPFFRDGGVDFSDAVEAMWIFDLSDQSAGLSTDMDFLKHFVTNAPSSKASPKKTR